MSSNVNKQIDVTEDIVMLRTTGSPFNDGNIICINQSDGLVFVDAGRIAETAKEFRKDMET